MYLSAKKLKRRLNWYPPYLGAGIRVNHISEDWKSLKVEMKLHWYNRNAVGSHFGGSLYSMVDPHLMLLLMQRLGRQYIVWDKSASIEYISASKTQVSAEIELCDDDVSRIKQATASGERFLPEFTISVVDIEGNLVAKIHKVLYVKLKNRDIK